MLKLYRFLYYFFVSFRKNVARAWWQFLIKDINSIGLFLGEWDILNIFENTKFFFFCNESFLQLNKELFKYNINRLPFKLLMNWHYIFS